MGDAVFGQKTDTRPPYPFKDLTNLLPSDCTNRNYLEFVDDRGRDRWEGTSKSYYVGILVSVCSHFLLATGKVSSFKSEKKGDRDFSLSLNTLHGVPLVMVSKHFYFFTRFAIMSELIPDLKQAKDKGRGISPVVHHFAAEQIL